MKPFFVTVFGAVCALAACGPDAAPETAPEIRAVEPVPVAKSRASAVGTTEVGRLLNARRAEVVLSPLSLSAQLKAAAQAHAKDMARNGSFSHTGSDGSSVGDRVRAQGYGFCFVAENIAQGQPTASAAMESWMNSTGHRRNNLSAQAREYGSARAAGNIWVLVFGASGC